MVLKVRKNFYFRLKPECCLLLLCLFIALTLMYTIRMNSIFASEIKNKKQVFSTWETFEVDKCASIWLIRRFVDKNAEIKFFPKGSVIQEGILFDTPEAKLRRYHNMSTFESILKYYNLQDKKLISIGKIIHDSEINIWDKKAFSKTREVEESVYLILQESKTRAEILKRSTDYFDRLYQEIVPNMR